MGVRDWFDRLRRTGRAKTYLNPINTPQKLPTVRRKIQEISQSHQPAEYKLLANQMKTETLREFTQGHWSLQSDMTSLYMTAIQDRRDYFEVSDEIRRYPIAARILKMLTQEILKPNERGEIINVVSEREDVNEELKKLNDKINFDSLLRSICKDVLLLGEYMLKIELSEDGEVEGVSDTVDQLSIIAFYDRGQPSGYLKFKHNQYYVEPPSNYIHFSIGQEKLRLALNDVLYRGFEIDYDKLPQELKEKIPEYVRVGEPVFFNVVEKIRQLQILETIVISTKLANITQRKLVSLQVPASMPVDKVMEACKKFEDSLNSQIGVDMEMDLITIADIMGQAGRFTVIPNYTDDKGSLTPLDARQDPQIDDVINAIADYREVLLTSLGIPYRLVFGASRQDTAIANRGDDIRLMAMFFNMIAGYQRSFAQGIVQLCMIHLINKGFKIKAKELDVIYLNASVNVGDLEKLEYDDAKQEIIGRKIDFLIKMVGEERAQQLLAQNANEEGFLEWLEISLDDLTDGIPLFKPGTLTGHTREHPATYPVDPKVKFLRSVKDQFLKNQQKRYDSGDSILNNPKIAPTGVSVQPNTIDDFPVDSRVGFLKQVKDNLLNLDDNDEVKTNDDEHPPNSRIGFLRQVKDKFNDQLDRRLNEYNDGAELQNQYEDIKDVE